ncbi:MAG: hypothetical protein GY775_01935, partial [Candidatus Scalindua sp.]|nr:hypothetical protein [Candidatus Scalindua sp.]
MKRQFSKGFIAIDQRLYDSDLDIYHINIISWILSYQEQEQPFFMSKAALADKFKCAKRTIYRRFEYLESYGILVRGEKYKKMYKYQVNIHRLNRYLSGTYLEKQVPESHSSSKTGASESPYNTSTNKTSSNKTSFRDEDDFKSSSSSKPKAKPKVDVNSPEFHKFLNDLDI